MGTAQIINLAEEALKFWRDELEEAEQDTDKNAIVYRQLVKSKINALESVIYEFSEV